jgi:hypothetical protein
MADLSKFKRKGNLGAPPPLSEASVNLDAPEVAPAPLTAAPPSPASLPTPSRAAPQERAGGRSHDGRSARRTGRTVQFATRVSDEFDARLRAIAGRDGLLLVEVLERALDAYEAVRAGKGT